MNEPKIKLLDEDNCILVDGADCVVGFDEKYATHQNPTRRHRAVSVWLFNSNNEVLFQQRSEQKIVGALWWGNTVCGNVQKGETVEQCCHRRLLQELAIIGTTLQKKGVFEYRAYCNEKYSEHEVDHVFTGVYETAEITPVSSEVVKTAWIPLVELQQSIREAIKKSNYPTAEQSLEYSWEELQKRTHPLDCVLQGETYLLVPWTVFMLQLYFA